MFTMVDVYGSQILMEYIYIYVYTFRYTVYVDTIWVHLAAGR